MASDLEAVKRRALAFLDGCDDAVIDLTRVLIAAPSPNLPGDETAPAAVVQEALNRFRLPPARTVAREPHRPNLLVTIESGRPGPHLALCGHLDTKPAGAALAEWRTDPLTPTIDGDRLYGLGSTDMKGAVAAMIFAGAAFAHVADDGAGSLTLMFTADEENGSAFGAFHLVQTGALAGIDAIVLGEPSGVWEDWDAIRIVSRGISCFQVIVRGTQMHSSISDMLPSVNAVEAMARVMAGFRREFRPRYPVHPLCPDGPTINIGVTASGGVQYGVLPGYAEFACDVRTTPGMDRATFEADVREALARVEPELQGATYEVAYHPTLGWTDAVEVPADHPMVRACQSASRDVLGVEPPLAFFPGGTDASPLQGVGGIPTLAAFGPGQLPLAHGANEWVSVTSIRQAMRMYALAAIDFGAGSAG